MFKSRVPKQPVVLGVLDVTSDSFSDGGRWASTEDAVRQARTLLADGADVIDVGGESTRPGAPVVPLQQELDRVLPFIERIVREMADPVSIDTQKFEVASAAVKAGATLVNDISGGADPRMPSLGTHGHVDFLLMHMQGKPTTMQAALTYPRGVVTEVREFLEARVNAFVEAGVPRDHLWIDPGIGFGKTLDHNLTLLNQLSAFHGIAARVAIGTSRKSFLAAIENNTASPFDDRMP